MDNNESSKDSMVKEAAVDYDYSKYTYSDYLSWDDDIRRELIDGIPYLMSAPNRNHQEISRNLLIQFAGLLKGKPYKVYHAPFDVRLNGKTIDDTVVQPDLLIVCDESKLDEAGCIGAPDLVVEILSPSTRKHDTIRKFNAYRKNGVREFWVIDPEEQTLAIHILSESNYIIHPYIGTETVPVHILTGCTIDLSEVFA